MLQVKVDSVTGRDDSLMDSQEISILGEGEMPFNVFADEVFERIKNVNSNLIICETLAILVQGTFDSGN